MENTLTDSLILGTSICGDGLRVGNQMCDDGNILFGDGCDQNCMLEINYSWVGGSSVSKDNCSSLCGTGVHESTEECEDENQTVSEKLVNF